jgi:hypothetical protein
MLRIDAETSDADADADAGLAVFQDEQHLVFAGVRIHERTAR